MPPRPLNRDAAATYTYIYSASRTPQHGGDSTDTEGAGRSGRAPTRLSAGEQRTWRAPAHTGTYRHTHAVTRPGQRSSEHRLTITTPTDLTAGPCRSQQRVALNPRGLPLAVRSAWHRASAAAASKRRRLVGASHTHQRRRIVQMRTSAAARSQRHAHDDDEKTRRCGHDAARRVRHAATARPR